MTNAGNCSPDNRPGSDPDGESQVYMKRKIGLLGGVGLVLGTIIGSGIFISPTGVVLAARSEAMSLIIWAIGGIVSMFGALSLAELASLIPQSAGEYNYLRVTYAKWLGFLHGWTTGVLLEPSGQALIAMTSSQYVLIPILTGGCGETPSGTTKLLAVVLIIILTAVNCYSVTLSSRIQIIFMIAKVISLVVIIVGGIVRLIQGHTANLNSGFEGTNTHVGQIMTGFFSSLFAYGGWTYLSFIVEEIRQPERNIPLTFYIAMPLVTVLYVLVNISYFTVMDTDQLLESPAVAITWANAVLPGAPWLMPLFVAISTFGSCNGSVFITGRLYYVMAREKEMPQILSMIHTQRRTPVPAGVFNSLLAISYILASEVLVLVDFLGFATWLFIAFVQLSVVVLRVRMKHAPRTYKVPIVFPAVVFFFSVALVVLPIVSNPQVEFLYASLVILSGLVFYIPIVRWDCRPKFMRHVTVFFQLLMEVCPTSMVDEVENDKIR